MTESIYAPARSRIEICYEAPVHLLVLYEDGVRREGETSIAGLPPSGLRNFANKLTFVPAGHSYREWYETSTAIRMTYLYLVRPSFKNPATRIPRMRRGHSSKTPFFGRRPLS